jgi:hypothetical protein
MDLLLKLNNYPLLENIKFKSFDNITRILKSDDILFDTLLYGSSGSGKITLLMAYLQKQFGSDVLKLTPNFKSSSNNSSNQSVGSNGANSSNGSNSANDFNLDKIGVPLTNDNLIVINDSVSDDCFYEYILEQQELIGEKINYMVILHLERYKKKTLSLLSNFIENRKNQTYVLATTNHFDKLDYRIISRFTNIRVPRPTLGELSTYFYSLIPTKFNFDKTKLEKIIESTKRDMKLSIIYINQRLLEIMDPNLKKKSIDNFKYYLNCLIQNVIRCELSQLPMIRTMILVVYQSSISWTDYVKKCLEIINMQKNIDENKKIKILELSANLDHKVTLAKPSYIHYEAFIFMIMNIIANE